MFMTGVDCTFGWGGRSSVGWLVGQSRISQLRVCDPTRSPSPQSRDGVLFGQRRRRPDPDPKGDKEFHILEMNFFADFFHAFW